VKLRQIERMELYSKWPVHLERNASLNAYAVNGAKLVRYIRPFYRLCFAYGTERASG
jgi:hypothetical protein